MYKLKLNVFVVGPPSVGKSAICNYLSDLSGSLSSEPHPTAGVRILEFERKVDPKRSRKESQSPVDVELWDCSGNPVFYHLWPALCSSANAVVYVIPPESSQDKDLDAWVEFFAHLKPNQSSLYIHRGSNPQKSKVRVANRFLAKLNPVYTSLDQEPELIKTEFDNLLSASLSQLLETREQQERSIAA